jgi:probable O-glycosylation ligase (exosortase A-associated)
VRTLLVLAAFAAATLLALNNVVFAAALFLWNDIFRPLEFARATGLFPAALYVLGILLASFLLNWFRGRVTPRVGLYFLCLAGLILWLLVTTVMSAFPATAWEQFITYLKYLLPLLVIHNCLRTRRDVKILAFVLCSSVAVWSCQAGLHCLIKGPNPEIGIPGGQMTDRNDFAAAIVGTVPLLVYFALSYDWKFRRWVRLGMWAAVLLSVAAIVLSLSRGGSLGLAASILLYVVYVSKRKVRDGLILVAVAGITLLVLPESWWARMATIEIGAEQTEGSARERMQLMIGAWRASLDNPLFGLGPACWLEVAMAYAGDDHNPHSIYLVLTSETGFPGLAIFLAIVAVTYWRNNQVIRDALRRNDAEAVRLSSALLVSIFGLLASMTFLNRPFNEYLWAWISIANAVPEIYAWERRPGRGKTRKTARRRSGAGRLAGAAGTEAEKEKAPPAAPGPKLPADQAGAPNPEGAAT